MSANREDALTKVRGAMLPPGIDVPAGSDPTEDLADEITSELGAAARLARIVPQPADVPAALTADGARVLRERYVLEAPLGAGGTAVVFRAVDLRRDASSPGGRLVAIKALRPELRDRPDAIARLQREFRRSQAAVHPGVVRMHDLDCDQGHWFIVMELLAGETLGAALRRAAPAGLPAEDALRIACAAGDALDHAHAAGVVHGDVKPDNIFLTEAGDIRLLDFGAAPETTAAAASEPIGAAATRAYASPEILRGDVPVPRDDVFSLACVTCEMLTGIHSYGRCSSNLAPPADAQLRAILDAALAVDRAGRPDMGTFVRGIRNEPDVAPVTAPAPVPVPTRDPIPVTLPALETAPSAVRPQRRGRIPLLAILAALFALMLGILIGRTGEAPPPAAPTRIVVPPPAAAQAPAALEADLARAPAPAPADASVQPAGPAGLVFFDVPRMVVSRRAVVAAIPMRNLSRVRRAVTLQWRIVEDSARAGRDFGGPTSGVESFTEGNSFRILYIPLLQDPGPSRERSFTVEMTGASAGTELGPTPRVEVVIQGDG